MGLKDERPGAGVGPVQGRWVRRSLASVTVLAGLLLAGCDSEGVAHLKRLGLPVPASDRAPHTHDLWVGSWMAAFGVGLLVWGLIVFSVIKFRRKRANEVPRQTRYNLPMELLYTVIPFVVIGVLFYYTVVTQDKVLAKDGDPQHVIDVVGQKWSWTFNYKEAANPAVGDDVWEAGTIQQPADLYLPVNETVRFNLSSPDVIHSFWVPSFYFKLDVIPGRDNHFELTPDREGTFAGKCAELCGTYHSAMIFTVHVVSVDEYNSYLKSLAAKGQTGAAMGSKDSTTIEGTTSEAGGQR